MTKKFYDMNVIKTAIDGVFVLEPRLFEDARGYFFESFNQREFEEKVAKVVFVQDNESKSSYGVAMRASPPTAWCAACTTRSRPIRRASW